MLFTCVFLWTIPPHVGLRWGNIALNDTDSLNLWLLHFDCKRLKISFVAPVEYNQGLNASLGVSDQIFEAALELKTSFVLIQPAHHTLLCVSERLKDWIFKDQCSVSHLIICDALVYVHAHPFISHKHLLYLAKRCSVVLIFA